MMMVVGVAAVMAGSGRSGKGRVGVVVVHSSERALVSSEEGRKQQVLDGNESDDDGDDS